jgi:hypothetical protein
MVCAYREKESAMDAFLPSEFPRNMLPGRKGRGWLHWRKVKSIPRREEIQGKIAE